MDFKSEIEQKAKEIGFLNIGFTPVFQLQEEARNLEKWLENGRNGKMQYMENHFDKRIDPAKLVDDAKTIISVAYNYYTDKSLKQGSLKISKYAYGRDYHKVVKKKLEELYAFIRELIGDVGGRIFTDSAPVMDKVWAEKAGLGWIGKNANLINKKTGSFFFLGELILDYDFKASVTPKTDHCGTCTRCLDACPTEAIIAPYKVDGSKCISYLTIELKDEIIPDEFMGKMDDWIFGCDICQDVCPWNRFSIHHTEDDFNPRPELLDLSENDWRDLNEESFNILFNNSPIKRTKYAGIKRNVKFTLMK